MVKGVLIPSPVAKVLKHPLLLHTLTVRLLFLTISNKALLLTLVSQVCPRPNIYLHLVGRQMLPSLVYTLLQLFVELLLSSIFMHLRSILPI